MLNRSRSNVVFAAYAPVKFFTAYLGITLAIALWGPIKYSGFPVEKTLIFMLAIMAVMVFGYVIGVESALRQRPSPNPGDGAFVRRLLQISISISYAGLLLSVSSAISSGDINTSFSEVGSVYLSAYDGYERNDGQYSLQFIVYTLTLPFNFISFVWGFYYFSKLNANTRRLVVGLAIVTLMFHVLGSGKQKQLGDILIYIFAVAAVNYGVRRKSIKIKSIALVSVTAIGALMLFIAILNQRYRALGIGIDNINSRTISNMYFDKSHMIFSVFGMDYGLNVSMFLSYLSQGYYGLGLALNTDWQWTHFMGFSYSLSVLANRVFGVDWEWPNTLLHQVGLRTGWGETKWHTVFTHFATDFTFPGTVLLFGVFAYVYARAWISAVRYKNPFSILMFALLTMGAFFMPANNQLLHTPGALFTTITISVLYVGVGSKFNVLPSLSASSAGRAASLTRGR